MFVLQKTKHRCTSAGVCPEHYRCMRTYCVHVCLYISSLLYNLQEKCVWKTLRLTWLLRSIRPMGRLHFLAPAAFTWVPYGEGFYFYMVAVVSTGFCRRAAVWLPGVSQSVYQSFSHLHTLLSIITSCTFPITPCTLLQLILPISNEISALLVCAFFSPHWTQYEMKPVLCKRVCGRDKRVLSPNMQLGTALTCTQRRLQPGCFVQTRLVYFTSWSNLSLSHTRERFDI